jgi:hypothetical protein
MDYGTSGSRNKEVKYGRLSAGSGSSLPHFPVFPRLPEKVQ